MIFKDSTILGLQFAASLFMAADYFFDEKQRSAINSAIQTAVLPVQKNVKANVRAHLDHVIEQWAGIVVACGFLFLGWAGVQWLPRVATGLAPGIIILLSIFFLILFAGAIPRLTSCEESRGSCVNQAAWT